MSVYLLRIAAGLWIGGLTCGLFSQNIRFRDIAPSAGLSFVLENHPTPQKHMIETMPGGVAAFDYDGDGLTDIYLTNGAAIPSLEKDSPKYFNRLYRNDGSLKFTDVTKEAGVGGAGYSMGAAAADYDNDGKVDLFVAGVYHNILYHNLGNGKFEDVTKKAGIKSDLWSVAAGWFDYDNDGKLDLFVVNYAKWTTAFDRFCGDPGRNIRIYCHPKWFEGLPNTLYHNRGDGTFEDVTERAGIAQHIGRGMSVVFADYDHDGFPDAFVTNDNLPNFLFHNKGDGTFEEVGLLAGTALLDHGKPVSSMGADFRDYNNDGWPDITITALTRETFPLFRNLGKGSFQDVGFSSRMGAISAPYSGWSIGFVDFNNDGWKDLFAANSHVNDRVELFEPAQYKQSNSIFVNLANGTFADISAEAGEGFQIARAHRGSAFADFDNDGKVDVVVSALGQPAELWHNVSPNAGNWLRLVLIGTKSNRDGIGARIRIGNQHNEMSTSVGYASSSHQGVHFGLGKAERAGRIEIRWPSGTVQVLENVKANQILKVREDPSPPRHQENPTVNLVSLCLGGEIGRVHSSDMRVLIPATGLYTYPDVVVVCGEGRLADEHRDTLLNPILLAEVLSPSTEAYDRGRKFEQYRTVESLQEYLLVAQDRAQVELYTRQPEGTWLLREANRLDNALEVGSIGCRLLLADLYDKVELPD